MGLIGIAIQASGMLGAAAIGAVLTRISQKPDMNEEQSNKLEDEVTDNETMEQRKITEVSDLFISIVVYMINILIPG